MWNIDSWALNDIPANQSGILETQHALQIYIQFVVLDIFWGVFEEMFLICVFINFL